MTAYYNEHNPHAADWIENLIADGLVAPGEVDRRDIRDIHPSDLRGFDQCHFFAGIGGWSAALRLAGWADSRFAWTGSCPCQPFSAAGNGLAFADERHLWPAWHWLIQECRPNVVFGEQVDQAAGRHWLDLVSTDLEALGYAVGAGVLPAASVGAPQGRHRLWLVAESDGRKPRNRALQPGRKHRQLAQDSRANDVADPDDTGSQGRNQRRNGSSERALGSNSLERGMAHPLFPRRPERGAESRNRSSAGNGEHNLLADASGAGSGRNSGAVPGSQSESEGDGCEPRDLADQPEPNGADLGSGPLHGFWRAADWIYCRDAKWRPVEPGLEPLVDGLRGRVAVVRPGIDRRTAQPPDLRHINRIGALRGFGNAIVPQVAAQFISAYMELRP